MNTSLKYSKESGIEVKVGDQIIPLSKITDPVELRISANETPVLYMGLCLDDVAVEDIEALAELVRFV